MESANLCVACMLMAATGLHVAEVCVIFKLPAHLSNCPQPLAYVHWFKLQTFDDNVKMFHVRRSTRQQCPHAKIILLIGSFNIAI